MDVKNIIGAVRTALSEPVITKDAPDGDGLLVFQRRDAGGYDRFHLKGERVGRRQHTFATPRALARFVNGHFEPKRSDILVGDEEIAVIADPSDPHCDRVTCKYRRHPEFHEWAKVIGRNPLDQRQMIYLIRATRVSLGEEQAEEWLTALGILRVVAGGHMESQVDPLGYTKLMGGDQKREVTTRIPPVIYVSVPLFEGILDESGVPHRYGLQVLVEFDAEERAFSLSCPELALARAEAVEHVAEMLERELEDDYLVVRGEASTDLVPAPEA